jgi:transposase-like protein
LNWILLYQVPKKLKKKKNIEEYSCIQKDETAIKAGSELIRLWIAIIKPKGREILLSISISKERKICVLYLNIFYLAL